MKISLQVVDPFLDREAVQRQNECLDGGKGGVRDASRRERPEHAARVEHRNAQRAARRAAGAVLLAELLSGLFALLCAQG